MCVKRECQVLLFSSHFSASQDARVALCRPVSGSFGRVAEVGDGNHAWLSAAGLICVFCLSCVDNLGQRGLCMERSACRGHSKPGYCPGAASIQCCITSERAHIVRPGETMWGIAQHERVPFSLLETANKQIRNPDRVWPNDRVWVPGFATSVRRPRVTTGGRGSATRTRGATTGRPSSPTTARRTTSRRSTTRRSTTRPSATTGRSTTRRRRSTTRRPSTPTTAPSDGSSGGSVATFAVSLFSFCLSCRRRRSMGFRPVSSR